MKEFISDKITKYNLNLDAELVFKTIQEYKSIYTGESERNLFYYYLKNYVGKYINDISEEYSELFGLLKIENSNNVNYYIFDFDEDFCSWSKYKIDIYEKLKDDSIIRILNFIELSTLNFINSNNSNFYCKIYDKNGFYITEVKQGKTNHTPEQNFIPYLSDKFKNNYNFKIIE